MCVVQDAGKTQAASGGAKTLKKHVIVLEVAGGVRKGPDGYRRYVRLA
jgi:hypothetical protein